jgi:hypothetical protein
MADCASVCNETLAYCLDQGGDHVESEHLKAMIDCIDICTVTARLYERESPLHQQAMELCAQACKTCEESCEEFSDDEAMQLCADTCRQCYEHCSQ